MTDLGERIRALHARDAASGFVARRAGDIPVSYEAIADEWLTAILCRDEPGAVVVSHRLDVADEGTNNRRRIFVDYNEAGQSAGLPRSVFCKATQGLQNRMMLGHSGAILCEVSFYNFVRTRIDFEAPRAFHAAYDPESFNSIIVLEDFAGHAEFCDETTKVDRAFVERQVALLGRMHGQFDRSPLFEGELSVLPTWHDRFSNLARFNLREGCEAGLIEAREVVPPRLFARRDEIWNATMRALDLQRTLPLTLCHGDVHLKNWYVTETGEIGLGDWGVTHRGHWSRDLAYMIATALDPADRRAWEGDLIALHGEAMDAAGGAKPDADSARLEYRRALMTALAFWTMTLKPSDAFPDMQPAETALTFIGRLATAVDDLGSLDACA